MLGATCLVSVLVALCLAARIPTPYQALYNDEAYDPRLWLAPYEHVVDAEYPASPCCYSEPIQPLRRRLDQYYWKRVEPWYYPARPPRVRLGHGQFTLLDPRDAVLSCEFPDSEDIVSNVIWVRADLSDLDVRAIYQQRARHCLPKVAAARKGSSLYLAGVGPLDVGLYRCLATSRRPGGHLETVFQDVEFFPPLWGGRRTH